LKHFHARKFVVRMKLPYRFSYQAKPVRPYSFKLTMKKPAGWSLFTPFEIYENETLWSALHLDDELLGVKLRSLGQTNRPLLSVEVFTKRRMTVPIGEIVKERMNDLLGVNDNLTQFYGLASNDPILKHVTEDLYGMHDTFSSSLFARATLAILLQMTSIKRSNQMMNCVIRKYGQTAEFDGKRIRVWPTHKRIGKLRPSQLARTCKVGYRAKLLVRLARVMTKNGGPTLAELKGLTREEATRELMELPGIGDYSADIINRPGGFPIDVWSAAVFGKLFYGKEPENSREAVEMVKMEGIRRWGEWSWMAFFYVVQDLENLSRKLDTTLRLE
jgi:3-methyladenine DNA glycosylase/8-oxoguanine DNA glycosylase